jgi:Chaperone of endosialidase
MTTKTNLALPTTGSLNWDSPLNTNFGILNTALGGSLSINASSNYAMSSLEAQNGMVTVSNSSGSDKSISCASVTGQWQIYNNSSYGLNIYAASGYTGAFVYVKANQNINVFSPDGANMYQDHTDVVRLTGDTMSGSLNLPANGLTVGTTQLYVSSGNVYTSGNFYATSNVTAYNTSDERLKSDIQTITDAIDKVSKMRGVSFTSNSDGNKYVGVIAQEVQKVVPEVVTEGDDGYMYVAYGNLIGVLINAINELRKRVEDLEDFG